MLSERIEERLETAGLSQAGLARAAGIPVTTLNSFIRRGGRSTINMVRIARVLQTTPAYLLGETDDPEADLPELLLSNKEHELLDQWRQLSERDQETVHRLLVSLSRRHPTDSVHSPKLNYKAGD